MRLGILGGTFDPVHYGHLLLAESCREECHLDQVWFVPTAVPPHKRQQELAPGAQRVEMLELATAGHPAFLVFPYEINRGGVNYTVDTLARIKEEDSSRELFFLMGADSLRDLPNWKEPARLCQLATPLVVRRSSPGFTGDDTGPLDLSGLEQLLPAERLSAIRHHQVRMPRVDLSSTEIRQRIADGRGIRYRTPRAVEKYIETHQLYRE
ncbi:MAG: nicotinate (nicotinamide) nucleotide adenylyltransferase [Planctomycetia bacterium]|nr:nicotinate (nicotinamide) nucleotide adenylyltransferase [Planctomycetia bacterium]